MKVDTYHPNTVKFERIMEIAELFVPVICGVWVDEVWEDRVPRPNLKHIHTRYSYNYIQSKGVLKIFDKSNESWRKFTVNEIRTFGNSR